jgi:hypothetical protein
MKKGGANIEQRKDGTRYVVVEDLEIEKGGIK